MTLSGRTEHRLGDLRAIILIEIIKNNQPGLCVYHQFKKSPQTFDGAGKLT